MKTAAIMQPTFLPWVGYFALMELADTFVFLDSVQFAKRSWQQRNQIKTAQGIQWITVPVFSKGLRDQNINEVMIDNPKLFGEKTVRTLSTAYGKTPYFKTYSTEILSILQSGQQSLCELNVALILCLARQLGVRCEFMLSSKLQASGSKAELLADICTQIGAEHYISAEGSRAYIEQSAAFQDAKIEVSYNPYQTTSYSQSYGDFVPYMSVIDLVFNEGPKSHAILMQGLEKGRAGI